MQHSSKNGMGRTIVPDKQTTFLQSAYQFNTYDYGLNSLKTQINRNLSSEEISKITKVTHKNIIALKKIGRLKKQDGEIVFWLHYEKIPYNLETSLDFLQTVKPETLKRTLLILKNYLLSCGIIMAFHEKNIGVTELGTIKMYIPAEVILTSSFKNYKTAIDELQKSITRICEWYQVLVLSKQRSDLSGSKKQARKNVSPNVSRYMQMKNDLELIRKKIKSEESKNTSFFGGSSKNDATRMNPVRPRQSDNVFYTPKSNIKQSSPYFEKERNLNEKRKNDEELQRRKQQEAKHRSNTQLGVKYFHNNYEQQRHNFDTESIDTYQLQLGEDFQMPSIRTNQKLRQTSLIGKNNWDTLTHRPAHGGASNVKIHESAGYKQFKRIIEKSNAELKQEALKQKEIAGDNKTVQQNPVKHQWRSTTIKSAAVSSNIQDKVQKALAKTKNFLSLLKNVKSFSTTK